MLIQHVGGRYETRIFTPLGGIGVGIFLICSGYGLVKSFTKNGLEKFLQKRLLNILVPYWVTVIVYNVINYKRININTFILNFILFKPIPYMWFVQLILILYIIFYITYKYVPNKFRIYIFIIFGFFLILAGNGVWAEQAFTFVIGLIIGSNEKLLLNKKRSLIVGLFFIIIGTFTLIIKQLDAIRDSYYIVMNVIQVIIKTASSIGIIYFTYGILNKFILSLKNIGKKSYELYLVHTLFLYMIDPNASVFNIIIYLCVCFIGVVLLKFCDVKILNRIKLNY